jgi:iron(III) transport system substrate-binding protein
MTRRFQPPRRPLAGFALLSALALFCGASTSATVSPSVSAAAKKEGTVVWYTTMNDKDLDATVKRFESLHPGINVQTLRLGSSQLPARIITEQRGGKYNADVISGDGFQVAQLIGAGAMQPDPNTEAEKFITGTVDPHGMWSSLYQNTTVLAWNPQRLKADNLKPPSSLADLTKPEWKGRIGIDAGALNWYIGSVQDNGAAEDLMKKIAANKPIMTTGHTETITQLESGEFDITPTAYGYLADQEKKLGRPIDFANPRPLLVTLNPIGLAKNAPHPDAGRVLIDWLLSKEGQEYLAQQGGGEISSRTDVVSNPQVWNPKLPYTIVRPPGSAQYNQVVQQFKSIFGIAG